MISSKIMEQNGRFVSWVEEKKKNAPGKLRTEAEMKLKSRFWSLYRDTENATRNAPSTRVSKVAFYVQILQDTKRGCVIKRDF